MKRVVAILAAMMIAILGIVPVVGANAEKNGYTMYVSSANGHGVRMRADWSTDAKVLFNLGEGRPVTVTAEDQGWSEVRVQVNGKEYNGYIMSKFLSAKDPLTLKQKFTAVDSFTVKPQTASANGKVSIWDTTSKKNEHKIRDLGKNEKVTVMAESRAWYKVVDQNGVEGYVAKAYVTK